MDFEMIVTDTGLALQWRGDVVAEQPAQQSGLAFYLDCLTSIYANDVVVIDPYAGEMEQVA